jgi:ornithine carbamoyltransferase
MTAPHTSLTGDTHNSAPPLRHFLQLSDFSKDEIDHLFQLSFFIKDRFKRYIPYQPLVDRTLAMVFEKSSTRTRVSFEAGMYQMGGSVIHLTTGDSQLGRGEPIEDLARVITRMVDVVMIRTYEQTIIERFAQHSRVPVINGLTNEYHPCQVLADIFTYLEHRKSIQGRIVAWVGDANNMCYTWLQAASLMGFKVHVSAPKGYGLVPERLHGLPKDCFAEFDDPMQAAKGAHLVTTDVWTSMGYEAEAKDRLRAFEAWQVNSAMMKQASADALFMHCLPAHRGEEVSAEVLESPQSVVWDEAENRMHVQKALLDILVLGRQRPIGS